MTRRRSARKSRPSQRGAPAHARQEQDISISDPTKVLHKPEGLPFRTAEFHITWAVTFVLAMAVYWLTVAPGLTGEDSGELIASAHLLGIAHPPGYPIWCILGKFFSMLPGVSVAHGVNLMSAFFGAATCAIVAAITFLIARQWLSAIVAGLLLAFSDTFWSQAVIAEVYTLNTFFLVSIVFALAAWQQCRSSLWLLVAGLLYGLSCTNHPTMWPLGILFVAFVLWVDWRGILRRPWVIAGAIVFLLIGLSVYAYLPIRAHADTYMNWGNPATFKDALFHILRKQYPKGGGDNPRSLALFIRQMGRLLEFMFHQFTPFVISLLPVGMIAQLRRRDWSRFLLLGALFGATSVGFVVMTNFRIEFQEIMVNSIFFVSAMPFAAIWVGLGVQEAIAAASTVPIISARLSPKHLRWIAVVVLPLIPFLAHYETNDKSEYYYAYDYGMNILKTLDQDAIFFPSGDHSSFTVMYLQAVEGRRLDVTIVDKYGYIERQLYAPIAARYPRFPDKRQRVEIERWIIENTDRPVYFTTKRNMSDLPDYSIAPVGILYRVFRPNEPVDMRADLWAAYQWRNLSGIPTSKDYTAKVILSDLHYFKGLLALEQGRPNAAIDEFRQVVDSAQDMKEVYNNLGSACAEKGIADVAAYFFECAVEIDPRYLTARRNLAFISKDLGRAGDAIEHFRAATEIAPMNLTYPMELAVLLEVTGQPEEALEIFEGLSRADPENFFFFLRLGFLYKDYRKDKASALVNFRKALELNPDQPDVREILRELEE